MILTFEKDDDDDEDDDDDPHRPVLEHLPDVAGAEPPLAALVEEILRSLLLVLEVTASNTGSTDHQLTSANWFLINKEQ